PFFPFSNAGFGIVSGFAARASTYPGEALQLFVHCGRMEYREPIRSEIMKLRSIELEVPDRESAVRFFRDTWGLLEAGERNGTSYLRGTEAIPYVVSVARASEPAVGAVTFSGSKPELARIRKRAAEAGARLGSLRDFDEPGGGSGFLVAAPAGHASWFVT